ncbi:MAG: MMPL family transporter [Clostridia bacterium]|nr:MMPL family transporter [Clostridia bacterium]
MGNSVVKHRKLILLISIILLIPSILGFIGTRVNYDILKYLPESIETVKGQNILLDDFGKGGFAFVMVENMKDRDVVKLKKEIENVDHVDSVIWYDTLADISMPKEVLPSEVYDFFNNDEKKATMMAVFFDSGTSDEASINALEEIRGITSDQCFVSGMTAFVLDLKNISLHEEPVYIAIAVIIAIILLSIFMDSFVIPFIFIASIGMAILYNMGSNYFLGEISYITKAISAVLQLGVTMDYSIFLWHSYKDHKAVHETGEEAMKHAINETLVSVAGSSITTIAGFIALCFMTFTLGFDIGVVMAKGVLIGVIVSVTALPAMILAFEKAIDKTAHKPIMINSEKLAPKIVKNRFVILLIFVAIAVPSFIGYQNTPVYYDLDKSVPQTLDFAVAKAELDDTFHTGTCEMILADANLSPGDTEAMMKEIEQVDGINKVLGTSTVLGPLVPREIVPTDINKMFTSGDRQLLILTTEYAVASDELNAQIREVNQVMDKYDETAMLIGEGPCTNDLIDITDIDFKNVTTVSVLAIFLIILLVLKSISIPVVLVSVIEVAIFLNLGLPYYQGIEIPFIAGICISTIQLGATVDYAILMTNKYKGNRIGGMDKESAITGALADSIPSIIVSALSFFGATIGVGLYSEIDIIGTLCTLMARGAIVSMIAVIFVLPSMLMLFDKIICKTTLDMRRLGDKHEC